jgi:hypothetical protein
MIAALSGQPRKPQVRSQPSNAIAPLTIPKPRSVSRQWLRIQSRVRVPGRGRSTSRTPFHPRDGQSRIDIAPAERET